MSIWSDDSLRECREREDEIVRGYDWNAHRRWKRLLLAILAVYFTWFTWFTWRSWS